MALGINLNLVQVSYYQAVSFAACKAEEETGTTEEEMVRWHHRLNGHEFKYTSGDGEGQGSLACCRPWGCQESDTTEQLNNSNKAEAAEREPPIPTRDPGWQSRSDWPDHSLRSDLHKELAVQGFVVLTVGAVTSGKPSSGSRSLPPPEGCHQETYGKDATWRGILLLTS